MLIFFSGVCDYGRECLKLAKKLKETSDDIDVICKKGRRGAFRNFALILKSKSVCLNS